MHLASMIDPDPSTYCYISVYTKTRARKCILVESDCVQDLHSQGVAERGLPHTNTSRADSGADIPPITAYLGAAAISSEMHGYAGCMFTAVIETSAMLKGIRASARSGTEVGGYVCFVQGCWWVT